MSKGPCEALKIYNEYLKYKQKMLKIDEYKK